MRQPKFRFHKGTGRYLVTLDGKDIYLGKDRRQAEQKYYRLLLERSANGGLPPVPAGKQTDLHICELIERYAGAMRLYYKREKWGRGYYAMRHLNKLFGPMRPDEFRVSDLRTVRESFLGSMCRSEANMHTREVVRFFKWCASMELCGPEVYGRLMTLDPLKAGRCSARETPPVEAVPIEVVEKTKKHLPQFVRDVISLQLLTGARSGEILALKGTDIDRTAPVWAARLAHHKTAHKGRVRTLYFGPQAQAILRPYLLNGSGLLFTPNGLPYTSMAYGQMIRRACVKHDIPRWHPHQLRHTAATELRKQFGVEAARVILGHSSLDTTGIYAEADTQKALEVIGKIG